MLISNNFIIINFYLKQAIYSSHLLFEFEFGIHFYYFYLKIYKEIILFTYKGEF